MSAIALILAKRGFSVSGSDTRKNHIISELTKNGIKIFTEQTEENINFICNKGLNKPLIIISTAIPKENKELQKANEKELKVLHRSDVLSWLTKNQSSILIAGSHGKTTTSTIITTLLASNKADPTAIVGGIIPYYKSNGHSGKGKFLVAEADESDGTIVKLSGEIGIITNIELDHTDYYPDIESLMKTIKIFSQRCKKVIANYDCQNLRTFKSNILWWSTETFKRMDFAAIPSIINADKIIANFYEKEKFIGEIIVPLTGLHNLNNAVGAISACRLAGFSFNEIQHNLKYLKSPSRRLDFKGVWEKRYIFDDYAHHPSEINATIDAARLLINSENSYFKGPAKRLVIIFEPHRYSRIKSLLEDFAISLGKADSVFLAPIYSAGEDAINGINNNKIVSLINDKFENLPIFILNDLKQIENILKEKTLNNDLIIFMGAGNINLISKSLIKRATNINKFNDQSLLPKRT